MSRRRVVVLLGGMASALAVMPAQASAGVYTVANCAADPSRYATEAFNVFATRGMGVTKACHPQGKGTRGIVVGNTVRRGRTVKRGAYAQISIDAPPGTQLRRLPLGRRAQAHRLPVRDPDVGRGPRREADTDAERARQREVPTPQARAAQADPRRRRSPSPARPASCTASCASAAADASRARPRATTRSGPIAPRRRFEDTTPPVVATRVDTPLTRGEWVKRRPAAQLRRERQHRRSRRRRDCRRPVGGKR